MADTTAPSLAFLNFIIRLDLFNGPTRFEIEAQTADEAGGSGVAEVLVRFDRSLVFDTGPSNVLRIGGGSDNFNDASPSSARNSFTVLKETPTGRYVIQDVQVKDRAGNTRVYSYEQLEALGVFPKLFVVGGAPDSTPPTLTGLSLPDTLDLSSGGAIFRPEITATDGNGSGLVSAMLYLDKPFGMADGSGSYFLLGIEGQDSFFDGTPGTAARDYQLTNMSKDGTYTVSSVILYDEAGNSTAYGTADLRALGVDTSITVTGGTSDALAPKLLGMWLPPVVAADGTLQVVSAAALDPERGSGVERVYVTFDRPIKFEHYESELLAIGTPEGRDGFQDLSSTFGANGFRLAADAVPGTYNVVSVLLTDRAGNITHHYKEWADLSKLGISTTMTIVPKTQAATASYEAAISGSKLLVSVSSSDWAPAGTDEVSLTLHYDPTYAHYTGVSVNGFPLPGLSAKVSEVGNVGIVTITGKLALPEGAKLQLALDARGAAGEFGYAIGDFTVNGKAQLFKGARAGTVEWGTEGADRFDAATMGSFVDGRAGVDKVHFEGAFDTYTLSSTKAGLRVDDGRDAVTLANVERIGFGDTWLAYDIDGVAGQVYRLYQAAFDRKPDAAGLGYWIDQMDRGLTLQQVAAEFIGSREFQWLYGAGTSAETFVTDLYDNVLHRAPDPAGFAYWVDAVQRTGDRVFMLVNFSESAENVAQVIGAIEGGISYSL